MINWKNQEEVFNHLLESIDRINLIIVSIFKS